MENIFLNKQLIDAKENYAYFFVKLVFSIMQIFFKLSIMLLLSTILNNIFINIITLLYTFYSLHNVSYTINYYSSVMNDIKNTIGYDELYLEIDLKLIKGNIINGMVRYGK